MMSDDIKALSDLVELSDSILAYGGGTGEGAVEIRSLCLDLLDHVAKCSGERMNNPHHVSCSAWTEPIGEPGCICAVVNRNEWSVLFEKVEALERGIDEIYQYAVRHKGYILLMRDVRQMLKNMTEGRPPRYNANLAAAQEESVK